jgi:hypothetical protein
MNATGPASPLRSRRDRACITLPAGCVPSYCRGDYCPAVASAEAHELFAVMTRLRDMACGLRGVLRQQRMTPEAWFALSCTARAGCEPGRVR